MEVEVGYISDEDGSGAAVRIRTSNYNGKTSEEQVETSLIPHGKSCTSFDSRQSTVAWGNIRRYKSNTGFPGSPRSDVSNLTEDNFQNDETIDSINGHEPSPRRSSMLARNNRPRGRTLSEVSESSNAQCSHENRDEDEDAPADELNAMRKHSKEEEEELVSLEKRVTDNDDSTLEISERSSIDVSIKDDSKKLDRGTKKKKQRKSSRKNRKRLDSSSSLLGNKAAEFFEQESTKMVEPSETLENLLVAIETPESGDLNRGFLVRRKNACGTLQVLTTKRSNQVNICWSNGVLLALTSVLTDGASSDLEATFDDIGARREYIYGRKRALVSLMNLSTAADNRLLMFHSAHLITSLVLLIEQRNEDCLRECCAILFMLAKSQEVRQLMLQTPRLLDAIVNVIKPEVTERRKKTYVHDKQFGEDDDDYHADHEEEGTYNSSSGSSGGEYDEGPMYTTSSETTRSGTSRTGEDSDGVSTLFTNADARDDYKKDASFEEDSLLRAGAQYDDTQEFIYASRQNVFALLGHLMKEKDNVYKLAKKKSLVDALIRISRFEHSPSQVMGVKLLAHLTRHRETTEHLTKEVDGFVAVIVRSTFSDNDDIRKYACFALQNLSQDQPCRQQLAITPDLLLALCARARQATDPEERLTAIHALKNLTEEPANLIPMTNTPECFATFMQIAHASDESVTEMMQYLGCDALSTLSHWFRSIATTGQQIGNANNPSSNSSNDMFVPSLKTIPYEQWK
jgi:hypothetical protein